MVSSTFIVTSLLSLVLPLAASADSHAGSNAKRHTEVAKRADGDVELHKRFHAPKYTWYYASRGVGACGSTVSVSDFVVALNAPQYGNLNARSKHCYKGITIHARGKSAHATIVDACPECAYGSLDMSTSLFKHFADMDVGEMTGTWEFDGQDGKGQIGGYSPGGGGGGDDDDDGDKPKSKSKSKTKTTTKSKSKTSTKATSTTSSSAEKTSTKEPTPTAFNFNAGPASGLAIPTGTVDSDNPNIINALNQIIVAFGGIAVAGSK